MSASCRILTRKFLVIGLLVYGLSFKDALAAEPAWLAPSYQINEIFRTTNLLAVLGLGNNSQVAYGSYGGDPLLEAYLWQPQGQFGYGPGTSFLGQHNFFDTGPNGKNVTSDGRFAVIEKSAGIPAYYQMRWWDGFQWAAKLDSTPQPVSYPDVRSPFAIRGVNDRGDIAFNYSWYFISNVFSFPQGTRSGLWSGASGTWLPIFPENTTRSYVLSMNANGVCCGVYRAANAASGTPFRGFTASYGTAPIDFTPLGTIGGYSQTHGINDAGELVGVTGTQNGGVRPFIYLPGAAHGLSAGLHELGPTMQGYTTASGLSSTVARMWINNLGQALLIPYTQSFATNNFLWQRGQAWPLDALVDASAYRKDTGNRPWYSTMMNDLETGAVAPQLSLRGFNDRGEMLFMTYTTNGSGSFDIGYGLLLRPQLSTALTLDKSQISPGLTNTVRLRLRNDWTNNLAAPTTPVLYWDGPGTVNILSGPTLANTNANWLPGATNEWVWKFTFTNETSGIFVAQGGAGTNNSTLAESAMLKVLDQSDLWVQRTNDATWKGDNVYYEAALDSQTREAAIRPTESASFNVRIQNDSERDRQLSIRATISGDPGWLATFKQGATDVTALMTNAGINVGTLSKSGSVDFTVTLRGITNGLPSGSRREVVFTSQIVGGTNGVDTAMVAAEIVNEIIVNITGDEADADANDGVPDVDLAKPGLQTTLRCALEFANHRDGSDLITFAIPGNTGNWADGVPQIEPATALPDITETVVIDGWSQNTNAVTPPIALSGKKITRPARPAGASPAWPGAVSGLKVLGGGSEIRGLVINHFPIGIELAGNGSHKVEGCYFGLDANGTGSLGNGVDGGGRFDDYRNPGSQSTLFPKGCDVHVLSAQNVVGGTTPKQRNHFGSLANFISAFSGGINADVVYAPVALFVENSAAFGNAILGNSFGLNASETTPIIPVIQSGSYSGTGRYGDSWFHMKLSRVAVLVTNAPGTLIGGSDAGAGNVFSGASLGVQVLGPNAFGATVQGNFFGVARDGQTALPLGDGFDAAGCGLLQVGGLTPGAGNYLQANSDFFSTTAYQITLQDLIDPPSVIEGNYIGRNIKAGGNAPEALVSIAPTSTSVTVRSNFFYAFRDFGLTIGSGNNTPPASTVQVIGNTFLRYREGSAYPGAAIRIFEGIGHSVIGNSLLADSDVGLLRLTGDVGSHLPLPPLANDDGSFDIDNGPNHKLNWPIIGQAILSGSQFQFQVAVETIPLSGNYTFHLYRCRADQWSHGQPEVLLATGTGAANAAGTASCSGNVAVNGLLTDGDYVCAIVTSSDGSSSEVGKVALVRGGPDGDADGLSNATEDRVPNRAPAPIPGGPQPGAGFGDGNGDNIADNLQPNVCSIPVSSGSWLTLVAPAGGSFSNVQPASLSTNNLPVGYTFPLGFISYTVKGLSTGSTVTITNVVHGNFNFTTVWAFGPTSGNASPHWYQLTTTNVADELRLTLTDANTGDHDLTPNGRITTLYGFGVPIPAVPQLRFISAAPTTINTGTNSLTLNRTVLSWPLNNGGTNYVIEYSTQLNPPEWHPLLDPAIITGGNLIITNLSADAMRFYRLSPGVITFATGAAPVLSLSRTSTNTILLSWSAAFTGFGLEQNTNLVSGSWTTVTNGVVVTNSLNQVMVAPASGNRFFRLKSQ